ncbi:hypothetical protein CDAR_20401 [Caerostris darwini]|uniref:Secreted protein n=1 Tax=Caerostris darwini TaxID=1538125 RepID=A0AAV4QCZ7_9ARAC|nr:hypothetical protein CDAR_20401 [Caerostris darwini]
MLSRKHWILPFVSDFATPYLRPICCCLPPPCFSMTTADFVRNCWEAKQLRTKAASKQLGSSEKASGHWIPCLREIRPAQGSLPER